MFVVTVPGSAPTKAALVRNMFSALHWRSFLSFGCSFPAFCLCRWVLGGGSVSLQDLWQQVLHLHWPLSVPAGKRLHRQWVFGHYRKYTGKSGEVSKSFLSVFLLSRANQMEIFSCHSIVLVCRRSGCRVHTLCHPEFALAGGHDSEAEARRSCLCQRHGHPDANAPWLVALANTCLGSNF